MGLEPQGSRVDVKAEQVRCIPHRKSELEAQSHGPYKKSTATMMHVF